MTTRATQRRLDAFLPTRKRPTSAVSIKKDIAQPQKRTKREAPPLQQQPLPSKKLSELTIPQLTPPVQSSLPSTADWQHEEHKQQALIAPTSQPPPTPSSSIPVLPIATSAPLHDASSTDSPVSPLPTAAQEEEENRPSILPLPLAQNAPSPSSPAPLPPAPTPSPPAPLDPVVYTPLKLAFLSQHQKQQLAFIDSTLTSRTTTPTLPSLSRLRPPTLSPAPSPSLTLSRPPVAPARAWPVMVNALPPSLTLPVSYRLLVSMWSALECSMGVRSVSSMQWSVLRPSMERVVQKSVDLTHLQQLLFLMPDVLRVETTTSHDEWGRSTKDYRVTTSSPASSVVLSALDSAAMTKRRSTVEHRMRLLLLEDHDRWYTTHGEQAAFNPRAGCWHSAFPLESATSIPRAEVVPLPSLTASKSLLDRVLANRTTARPGTPLSSASTEPSTPSCRSVQAPSPFSGRSAYVQQFRVRAVAEAVDELDRETAEQLERLQHLGKLPVLLDLLHFLHASSGKALLPEADVLHRAASNPQFTNAASLRLELALLQSTLPDAFVYRTIGSGKLMGLRSSGSLADWKAALKAAKDREEAAMRDERARARDALRAAGGDVVELRPRQDSPAKRSLADALGKLSAEGKARRLYE